MFSVLRAIVRTLCGIGICTAMLISTSGATQPTDTPDASRTHLRWDVRIPLRDGVELSAIAYLPRDSIAPAPCLFTLTPYTASSYHDAGVYFAAHGLPFLSVDVRGRGN